MILMVKMMLNSVMRRECNRLSPVLPFSLRLISNVNQINGNPYKVVNKSHLNNNKDLNEKIDNKLENNPFYGKYLNKIEKAVHRKGLKDDQKEIESNLNQTQSENKTNDFHEEKQLESKSKTLLSRPKDSLADIVKLDLLRDKSDEEIANLWNSYHKSKDCIYGIIPGNSYDKIFSKSSKYPTFVFPIPRMSKENNGNCYEFVLSQFRAHKCFFTPLIGYQTHGENSAPCLTISHFPELQVEKGIVLMSGEYDTNILNCFEAQCLANQLQWYYSGDERTRQSILLHAFNKEPNIFNYIDLIKELENRTLEMGLSHSHIHSNQID